MTLIDSVLSTVTSKLGLGPASPTPPPYHSLDPLSAGEIASSVQAIRNHVPGKKLWFKSTQLIEPPKSQLAPWLDGFAVGAEQPKLPRQAETLLGVRDENGAQWSGE